MPGTFAGSSTSHTASRFCVPASVRSKPGASPGVPRWTRSAIGPLPGFSGAAASLSDHRSQPARDRCVIRCRSPACRPRYLPHRLAPVTVWPCSALIGGSKVLSTDSADTSTRPTVSPTAWRRRWSASASTSGSSGMCPVCRSGRTRRPASRRPATAAQLTIDSTIAAQIAVHQKSSMYRPQWVVCSVIHEVIHSISALMTMWIRPSVRMYSGIEMICTIGLMNALTRPKITATTKMMPTLCQRGVAADETRSRERAG